MRILVADNDFALAFSIETFLKNEGHEVIVANEENEALELLRRKKPDLIISDIMMPDLAGLSLVRIMKNFWLGKTPVIVTSYADKRNAFLELYERGASNFLLKPINFNELAACVNKIITVPPKAA